MSGPVSVAIAGIGGYGNTYLAALFDPPNPQEFRLVGAIDPSPTSCVRLGDLKVHDVPLYPSLESFYAERNADLMIICTPLHLHAEHACAALSRGSHVLCEKPLCVTPQQVRQMMLCRDRANRHLAVGYQWSYSHAVQELKKDILDGKFGAPKRLRSMVLWPRDLRYYGRNRWAGVKCDDRGNWVLDSPVNNACAHYLHNMLYVFGSRVDRSAQPVSVNAELYRANAIENYDTAVLKARTRQDVELLLVVSHATGISRGPIFSYEFERGTIEFVNQPNATITARFADGSVKDYGSPNEGRHRKLWLTIKAVREGTAPLCGIEAATPHTLCTWAAQQSADVIAFPADRIRVDAGDGQSQRTWVEGLDAQLTECYEQFALPSEMGIEWAEPSREVSIDERSLRVGELV